MQKIWAALIILSIGLIIFHQKDLSTQMTNYESKQPIVTDFEQISWTINLKENKNFSFKVFSNNLGSEHQKEDLFLCEENSLAEHEFRYADGIFP